MISNEEKKFLESLLNRENIVAKKLLEGFIWGNTTESNYKVNDIVQVRELNHFIFGNRVNWFVGIIREVKKHSLDKSFTYSVECFYKVKNKFQNNKVEENSFITYVGNPINIRKFEDSNINANNMYVNKLKDLRD